MAIIKYRVEATVTRSDEDYDTNVIESAWQYEEVKSPEKVGKLLSREEALKRIEELGMIQVFTSPFGAVYDFPDEPFGAVYDFPDEPFWEKYEGYYSRGRIRNRKS